MWATRNRIAHGYAYVDAPSIRATVERDLPMLEADITEAIEHQYVRAAAGPS